MLIFRIYWNRSRNVSVNKIKLIKKRKKCKTVSVHLFSYQMAWKRLFVRQTQITTCHKNHVFINVTVYLTNLVRRINVTREVMGNIGVTMWQTRNRLCGYGKHFFLKFPFIVRCYEKYNSQYIRWGLCFCLYLITILIIILYCCSIVGFNRKLT